MPRSFRILIVVTMLAGGITTHVRAQQTDLDACLEAPCHEEGLPTSMYIVACPGYPSYMTMTAYGRQWWGPLLCVGPIQVSLQALVVGAPTETLPLLIEARIDLGAGSCRTDAGEYLWQTYGLLSCDPDSIWVTSPVIDLPRIVGLGNQYWFQLEGLETRGQDRELLAASPYLGCLRLRAFPTAVTPASWTQVKAIYGR